MAEQEIEGGAGRVKVETTEDGKTRVSQEFVSTADALEFADQAARKRRSELGLMDKVIAWDEWFSPKARRVGETVLKITAVMGLLILCVVVAMNSGEAAILLLPDAPFPDWIMYAFGALTVPIGLYAADQFIGIIRDDVDDERQKPRKFAFLAMVILAIGFDSIGVVTARVAYSTGSIEDMENARIKAKTLKGQIEKGQRELRLLQPPLESSEAIARQVDGLLREPTRTGKPVQTVGELKDLCAEREPKPRYCFPYQQKFSYIDMRMGDQATAEFLEQRGPELEANIAQWQTELDALETSGAGVVDEFFARGADDAEVAEHTRAIRFWRTIFISLGQVALLAILAIMFLDDRHDRLEARRRKKREKGSLT